MSWKILIADDESDIVAMLGSFFESRGFCVLRASNGAEALRQAEKQPDIILLDINMPGTDWRSAGESGIIYPVRSCS